MDIDLNQEFGGELWTPDILSVDQAVDNRDIHEWDLNMDVSSFFDDGEVEMGAKGEGEPELDGMHLVSAPAVEDEFDSVDEAYQFWRLYGYQSGFGVCERTNHRKGEHIVDYKFAYNKFRPLCETTADGAPFLERRRPYVSSHCKAFLKIKISNITGIWRVCNLNLDHHHDLSPDSSFLIPAFRYIPMRYQGMLDYNEQHGLTPADNIEMVIKIAGGYSKCTFTRKDACNHVDKYRRSKLRALGGHDAITLSDYFEKKVYDVNFWYTYKHTDDGHLCNIFWADGHGRTTYKYFHDVVVLDATYLTNRYDMLLIMFVGVNHHWQTVMFACALLARETEEDYKWCMEKFLACMNGVKPSGILTDQCTSIELDIRYVLAPETVHRYFSWHILHKLSGKWGNVQDKEALTSMVKSVVYNSDTALDFDESWLKLMEEIGYEDEEWFRIIFSLRDKWVPAYLNDRFWAGMTTT